MRPLNSPPSPPTNRWRCAVGHAGDTVKNPANRISPAYGLRDPASSGPKVTVSSTFQDKSLSCAWPPEVAVRTWQEGPCTAGAKFK